MNLPTDHPETDQNPSQGDSAWHTPLRPVRDLVPEQVFAREWKALMGKYVDIEDDVTMFDRVLRNYPFKATERHSRVLASVVTWFGTNCGNSFLLEAERLRKETDAKFVRHPYLMQWALENVRESWSNGGVRTLEHCVATKFERSHFGLGYLMPPRGPTPSADDYEVVEHLMLWLGTRDGQDFLTLCAREAEVERLRLDTESRRLLGIERQPVTH